MFKLSETALLIWSVLEAERKLKAKREAEARALAAAPTELKRCLTRFFFALRDYHESAERQRTEQATLFHIVDERPLAEAAVELAAAVKRDIPEFRVPELLHLEAELRRHHGKPERGEDLDPALRQRIDDAIALGKELHLLPDEPRRPGRGSRSKRARRPRGNAAAGYDMQALQLVQAMDAKGLPWNITSIARQLNVPRSTLNAKDAKGRPRCPLFMAEAKKRRSTKVTYLETVDDLDRNGKVDISLRSKKKARRR